MSWSEAYQSMNKPSIEQIAAYISNPVWDGLLAHLESSYNTAPSVEYSVCSGAPGWNVKYKKSGRALCTLYPDEGFFTCLVAVGGREAAQAEELLPLCTQAVRKLYWEAKPFNGARWLMIKVADADTLEDVKRLIALRAAKKQK